MNYNRVCACVGECVCECVCVCGCDRYFSYASQVKSEESWVTGEAFDPQTIEIYRLVFDNSLHLVVHGESLNAISFFCAHGRGMRCRSHHLCKCKESTMLVMILEWQPTIPIGIVVCQPQYLNTSIAQLLNCSITQLLNCKILNFILKFANSELIYRPRVVL